MVKIAIKLKMKKTYRSLLSFGANGQVQALVFPKCLLAAPEPDMKVILSIFFVHICLQE